MSYSGETLPSITLRGYYARNNSTIHFIGHATRTTEKVNDVAQLYEYNEVKRRFLRLSLSYIHRIFLYRGNLSVSVGLGNTLLYSDGEQRFKSLLYPQGRNQRKAYIFSPVSVSALLHVEYKTGRSNFVSQIDYTVFGLTQRPGDNYVKQIEIDYSSYWQYYDISDFPGWQYSFTYEYAYGRLIPSISYDVFAIDVNGFRSFQQTITAGIALAF
jgi:hypothetical protein